jgi:hypothetical protein
MIVPGGGKAPDAWVKNERHAIKNKNKYFFII